MYNDFPIRLIAISYNLSHPSCCRIMTIKFSELPNIDGLCTKLCALTLCKLRPRPLSTKKTPKQKQKSKNTFTLLNDHEQKQLMPPNGVEPVTSALLVPRSTN